MIDALKNVGRSQKIKERILMIVFVKNYFYLKKTKIFFRNLRGKMQESPIIFTFF